MADISLTPNSMTLVPLYKALLNGPLSSIPTSDTQFWEVMRADDDSDTEDFETEYACKMVREQESVEETMVVKLMIRKPGNEESAETSTTLLEITGTKSVTKELVVKRRCFTVRKDQIGARPSTSTNNTDAQAQTEDSRVIRTNSMSLKDAIAIMRQNSDISAPPQITPRPPLHPKVVQQGNIISDHIPFGLALGQPSASVKLDFDSTTPPKHHRRGNPSWPNAKQPKSAGETFQPPGRFKTRFNAYQPFMVRKPHSSWNFLLRRPMYLKIMTVKPIHPLNKTPKCSEFVLSGLVNESPLERYLATRSVTKPSLRFTTTSERDTRTSGPSMIVAALKRHYPINARGGALINDTRRLMTGRLSVGNSGVKSEMDASSTQTLSLSRLKMPATLKAHEEIYPFRLVPSIAERRPLETMDIWIATLDAAQILNVISFIKQHLLPLEWKAGHDVRHIYRVKKPLTEYNSREIFLCTASVISQFDLTHLLTIHAVPVLHPRLARASRWPAHTPQQFESFCQVWPIKGYAEKHRFIPRDISVSEMEKFMRAAIRLSQQVYKIQDKTPYNLPIATLIVDPVTSRIVASTFDTRVSMGLPLNHSVVTAINLLAISPGRRGGDYYARGYDFYTTHEPCDMCCMAMIHSRVRRCIWWKEMTYTGGRGLGWRKELKHRYMSFQWVGDESIGKGVVEDVAWDICA